MAKIGIVGAGFTGLTAANYLAKEGHEVIAFEKHDKPGGAAMSWVKPVKPLNRKYIGESIHVLAHLNPGQELRNTIEGAGVDFEEEIGELVQPKNFARGITLEGEAIMPNSDREWEEMLTQKFPESERGVHKFFNRMRAINEERFADSKPGWKKNLLDWAAGLPGYLSFVNMLAQGVTRPRLAYDHLFNPTWNEILQNHFKSEEEMKAHLTHLTAHFHLLNGYIGLSSEECPSPLMTIALAFYTINAGAQMPKNGSFQKIPEAMARAIFDKDGRVFTHASIEDIIFDHGKVKSVVVKAEKNWEQVDNIGFTEEKGRAGKYRTSLQQGNLKKGETKTFDVDYVIWTADPKTLMGIAAENAPEDYANRINKLEKSTGLTGFHAIVSPEIEKHAHIFDVASLVVAEQFADFDDPDKQLYLTCPSLHRNGLIYDFKGNSVPEHVLNFYVQDRDREEWIAERKESGGNKGDYRTEKMRIIREKLAVASRVLGMDIQEMILHMDPLTPATSARYMHNEGEVYGYRSTNQFVPNNLSKITPFDNLILASHYTFGAGGVPGALNEGKDAARIILEKLG